MKNIRAFDKVIITDSSGVYGQKGGFDSNGEWSVVSSHDEFLVLSRGARILRVNPNAVKIVGRSATSAEAQAELLDEEVPDGEEKE